jgi:hypothetical protein
MAVTITGAASAAKAPPVKSTRVKAASPAVSSIARAEALEAVASIPVAICIAIGQLADAGTIEVYWPSMSAEISKLADAQAAIAKWIDPLAKVGPYTGILAVGLPMLMQFAVNHGRGTAGAMGTVSPDLLSARIQLRIAKAEAEALQAQLAAEREARETRAEIDKARQDSAVRAA